MAGVVTDQSGNYIQGAEVRVAGASTITDREGQFRVEGVPPGSYRVAVDYLGYQSASADVNVAADVTVSVPFVLKSDIIMLDAFKVESIRVGQSRAINQQRAASSIMNVISSDAIGNLPDRTVGEALGRLPGVNVVDDSYASIRGTAAQYNAVQLDGDRLTSAGESTQASQTNGDNRAVDLSMIPAEIVGGIEVIKALTPDRDADSFGGIINLVTRSAFDLKERSINGKFEYIYNAYDSKTGFATSLTYMDVLNQARTLGLSASITYRKEKRSSDKYEFTYYPADSIPFQTGTTDAIGDQAMEQYDTRFNFDDITKLGVNVNLDWKVFPTTELHFRTFYEGNDNDNGRYRNRARALQRYNAASTAQYEYGAQVRFSNNYEDGYTNRDTLRLGIEGKTTLPFGVLEYGVRYGDATSKGGFDRYIFEFPSNTERRAYDWSLDRSNPQYPIFAMTHRSTGENGLFHNLADRKLSSIRFNRGKDDETDLSGNVDYTFPVNLGQQRVDIKTGLKYRGKDRHSRPSIRDYMPNSTINYSEFSIASEPRDLIEGSLASMGPYVSMQEVLDRYYSNPSGWTGDTTGGEILRMEARKYDVSEDILAGYAMGTTKFGRLEVIAGLRWEQTKTSYTWLADPNGPSSGDNSYGRLYPSILLNYRITPNLVLRGAYTNTLARPNYGELVPYRVDNDTQADSGMGGTSPDDYTGTTKIFLGNADLKAQQSQNIDLSIEYYIQPSGVLSAAFFHKDLADVIYRSQWMDPDPVSNTIYFQDRNGSNGKVNGIEFSWQQVFTFLPGPLDGLGINANVTFTDGHSTLEELVPGTTDQYRPLKVDFLPEQPKRVYNVQLWWEKYGFTARVAMNHVADFVRTTGGLTNMSINYPATRWDVSLSYRVTKNFTIYLEGRNLTEEVTGWYASTPNRPESYSFNGRTISGGVKFRF
ncbi:TonB-dependent receptor [Termitidicoccus mucosus]|uniref:TonB-dependent receptor n=1 Tax=Termitidicoccus mucosus TaxID=1184151 RepID=A0A178IJI9_9BACT|nr:hypothetical protein AW736_09650 [Opitutaceae bacterium TSB47]